MATSGIAPRRPCKLDQPDEGGYSKKGRQDEGDILTAMEALKGQRRGDYTTIPPVPI